MGIMQSLDDYQEVTESDRATALTQILAELERLTVLELVAVLSQLKLNKGTE